MPTYPSQYYNRFNASKKYKALLFRAAKGLQSAELNEIQATLQNEIATVTEAIYGNGAFLVGGDFQRRGDTRVYDAKAGNFFADGYTHAVAAASFTIGATETVNVGVGIRSYTVGEDADPALRDPATSARNYNEPGAHRLKYEARWIREGEKLADESFYNVARFENGLRMTNSSVVSGDLRAVQDFVARYDSVTNGSYVINGMTTRFVSKNDTAKTYTIEVLSGLARVEGYEQQFETPRRFTLDYPTDVRQVNNEPATFTGDGWYTLRWNPIQAIGEVNGIKEVTRTITHGNFSGVSDILPDAPVVQILEVTQGATTYVAGTDFIQRGDYIDWSANGAEPSPGSSYTVKYRYSAVITTNISSDLTKVYIAGLATGTVFYVDYTHYIPRYDTVVLTKSGTLTVLKGTPNYLNPKRPVSSSGLELSSLYLKYGTNPAITSLNKRSYNYSDLYSIESIVTQLQLNVAKLSLSDNLSSSDPTTTKLGQFVDPFLDDDLRDAGVTQNAGTRQGILAPTVNWTPRGIRAGGTIRLPYTEVTMISQTARTGSRKVNQFAGAGSPPAAVTISPKAVRWITTEMFRDIWQSRWVADYTAGGTVNTGGKANVGWLGYANVNDSRNIVGGSSVSVKGTEDVVITAPVPNTSISVNASKFNAAETVDIYIDDILVKTVNADATGTVDTTFLTPTGMMSGTKAVSVRGRTSFTIGEAVFTALPVMRTITRDVTTVIFYDPLAQTFAVTDGAEDTFLTSVDLYVTKKSPFYIDVLLVEAKLGIPDRTAVIAGPYRKRASDIVENAWNKWTFADLPRITNTKEYAFIVIAPDETAEVAVAELGKYDTANGKWLTKGAYDTGVLLESSNLSTWSPIQREDLAFVLRRAKFSTGTTNVTINAATSVSAVTDLMLLAANEQPDGTETTAAITLLGLSGQPTYNVTPYEAQPVPEYTGDVRITVSLTSRNDRVSPSWDGDFSLSMGQIQLPASYVTRIIPMPATAKSAKVYLDIFEPSNASIKVYLRNAADTDWVELTRDTSNAVNLGEGIVEMPFVGALLFNNTPGTRIKIVMTTVDKTSRPAAKGLKLFFY